MTTLFAGCIPDKATLAMYDLSFMGLQNVFL